MNRQVRSVGALFALGASAWVLRGPLARSLPAPPIFSPERWRAWLGTTDPVTAAFTVLRLAALVLAAWLAVGVAVVGLVRLSTTGMAVFGRSARVMRALVPQPILATAALLLGAASAGCARSQTGGAVAVPSARVPATVTISQIPMTTPAAAPSGGSSRATGPSPEMGRAASAPSRPEGRTGGAVWVIKDGDSMWSIARAVVASNGGAPVDVSRYWVRLVRANPRPDPDLIFPGQALGLPPYAP
jgi:hypothetical protein